MEKRFFLYVQNVLKFLHTLSIKFDPFIKIYNNKFLGKLDIDEDDPTTYPYFINLCGEYHPLNQTIYVSDFVLKRPVILTKENAQSKSIREKYLTDFILYKELLNKYPEEKYLIRSMFFPINYTIEELNDLPNFTLLGYDTRYLNDNEISDIITYLKSFLEYYNFRWYINTFEYEEMYPTVMWSILWQILPLVILYRKILNIKTSSVDEFHVWEYLVSKGLEDYTGYLTTSQNMFLYKNIDYLLGNLGKIKTSDILKEVLLKPMGLDLESKWIYHHTRTGIDDAKWGVDVINKSSNTLEDNNLRKLDFDAFLSDLETKGLDKYLTTEHQQKEEDKFVFTRYNKLLTKYQEVVLILRDFKYYEHFIRYVTDNLAILITDNMLDFNIIVNNTFKVNDLIGIEIDQIIPVLYYIYNRRIQKTPQHVPDKYTSTCGFNYKVDLDEIRNLNFKLGNQSYSISQILDIDDLIRHISLPTQPFKTSNEISYYLNKNFEVLMYLLSKFRKSNDSLYRVGYLTLIDKLYPSYTFKISKSELTYAEFFTQHPILYEFLLNYEKDDDLREFYDDLIYQIYENFMDLNETLRNYIVFDKQKNIKFEKMKKLFVQFNSYLVRILDNDLVQQEYIFGPCMTFRSNYDSTGKTIFNYSSKGITFRPL